MFSERRETKQHSIEEGRSPRLSSTVRPAGCVIQRRARERRWGGVALLPRGFFPCHFHSKNSTKLDHMAALVPFFERNIKFLHIRPYLEVNLSAGADKYPDSSTFTHVLLNITHHIS